MRFAILAALTLSGCSLIHRPTITAGATKVVGVQDGKQATLNQSTAAEVLAIPEGSTITMTKHEAQPAIAATETSPAFAPAPAFEQVDVRLSKATEWRRNATAVQANTGTIDTSLAQHRIDVEENRWLLWASIACIPIAIFFVYIQYPTPAMYSGAASAIFFVAWKVADLPSWFWALGGAGLVAAFCIWRAHERGLKTTVSDVITDVKKVVNVVPQSVVIPAQPAIVASVVPTPS